jgi:hypothetical protein
MYADLWRPIIQIPALEKSAVLLEMRYGVTLAIESLDVGDCVIEQLLT